VYDFEGRVTERKFGHHNLEIWSGRQSLRAIKIAIKVGPNPELLIWAGASRNEAVNQSIASYYQMAIDLASGAFALFVTMDMSVKLMVLSRLASC
jgi:hypothetical protein